jgi:hypothetical protein
VRPWAQLERILARLPRHSHYRSAIEDDEQFAAAALAMADPDEERAPVTMPLTGYSDQIARLDNVFDAVCAVNETLISVYSKKNAARPRPHRAPRPKTAAQRLLREQKLATVRDIEAQMTGGEASGR